ncbi:hypothetical protein [Croceicoccus sp. Ery5]|jgi:hypothetical protein|uniref:hypothetical protein n=1 Tax=Croceicoccus sp. Ery5 TaxID=1703340 RepID=UPI001E41E622|nr:hypothetical protein [Croceicoccus sp. Ery5]
MQDLATVAIVMAVPVLLLLELRRILSNLFVNRSIRKALEVAPDQVPSLLAKLEEPVKSRVSGPGLATLLLGGSYLVGLLFSGGGSPTEIAVSSGVTLLGGGLLASRWAERREKPDAE